MKKITFIELFFKENQIMAILPYEGCVENIFLKSIKEGLVAEDRFEPRPEDIAFARHPHLNGRIPLYVKINIGFEPGGGRIHFEEKFVTSLVKEINSLLPQLLDWRCIEISYPR